MKFVFLRVLLAATMLGMFIPAGAGAQQSVDDLKTFIKNAEEFAKFCTSQKTKYDDALRDYGAPDRVVKGDDVFVAAWKNFLVGGFSDSMQAKMTLHIVFKNNNKAEKCILKLQ